MCSCSALLAFASRVGTYHVATARVNEGSEQAEAENPDASLSLRLRALGFGWCPLAWSYPMCVRAEHTSPVA